MSTDDYAMDTDPYVDFGDNEDPDGAQLTLPLPYTPVVQRTLDYLASPVRIMGAALFLGWTVDLLFYGKALGISVPIFVLLLLGALFAIGKAERVHPALGNLWIVPPLIFFAAMVAVRANFFLTILNVLACGALLTLLAYFYSGSKLHRLGIFGYPLIMAVAFFESITQIRPLLNTHNAQRAYARSPGTEREARFPLAALLRGVIIALPLLIMFAALLASADTIFASYLSGVISVQFMESVPELLWRLVIILCVAWVVAGGLAYAMRPRASDEDESLGSASSPRNFGPVEAATVLVAVNLLFAAFVAVQFAYLFAGRTLTTLEASNYKHYARRGFGELIAVSVLTMGMILVLRWWARLDTPGQLRLFNILGTIMVGLSLVILTSAWLRMFYWEEVSDYIATSLRLYVRVFIVWLALTYLWMLVCLWSRPALFAVGAFVAAICYLGTLDVVNPDDNVVRYNIARASVRELYFPYLDSLSEDAVPALLDGARSMPANSPQRAELLASLTRRLAATQNARTEDPNWDAWQSFNLSRARAYDELTHAGELVK